MAGSFENTKVEKDVSLMNVKNTVALALDRKMMGICGLIHFALMTMDLSMALMLVTLKMRNHNLLYTVTATKSPLVNKIHHMITFWME